MINAEKYRDKLLKFIEKRDAGSFTFSKGEEGNFWQCGGRSCFECGMVKERSNCSLARLKWLLSEYKEPVKLTKIEYYILKWAKENAEFKYLVRLKNGNLCAYSEKPFKDNQHHVWANKENVNSRLSMFNDLFEFINCEDLEPTSIEDVLGNCEVIKNESDK